MIEIMITIFIIGTVVTGMFGMFILNLRAAQEGERRIAAIALANERMEMIRNLPYVNVGTDGGVPSGTIPQSEVVARNNVSYTVLTDIRYVDDPYDNQSEGQQSGEQQVTICHHPPGGGEPHTMTVGAPALDAHLAHGDTVGPCEGGTEIGSEDEYNTDYKQVRVSVSWPSPNNAAPVLLITLITPQGIEGGEVAGTLDFQALNASGQGVQGAEVTIINETIVPPLNLSTQTNQEGRVVLPGLPAGTDYEISVTKEGYTSEQTYDQTSTFFPYPDYSHLAMVVREITYKTFQIDQAAAVTITAEDEDAAAVPELSFTWRGSKTIGEDDENELVYKMDLVEQTDSTGQFLIEGITWDVYDFSIDGTLTGYDIKETDPITPLTVNPADNIPLNVKVTPHTPISLQLTVVNETGAPVNNVTAHLTGFSHDETLGTGVVGQVYFGDLPSNGDYTLDLDAPGYEPKATTVTIEDTTRVIVDMAAVQ